MGIDHLPSVGDYWSKDPLLHYAPTADRILRWRFRGISRYLHFVDNDHLAPRRDPTHDRLEKVRPLIDLLSLKFETLYEPSKNVAVDNAMIKFQGRSFLKQYMPIKRGIKVWVLGDSSNGYFSRRKEDHEVNLGAYHHVHFDTFRLLEDLEKYSIYGCGTARKVNSQLH